MTSQVWRHTSSSCRILFPPSPTPHYLVQRRATTVRPKTESPTFHNSGSEKVFREVTTLFALFRWSRSFPPDVVKPRLQNECFLNYLLHLALGRPVSSGKESKLGLVLVLLGCRIYTRRWCLMIDRDCPKTGNGRIPNFHVISSAVRLFPAFPLVPPSFLFVPRRSRLRVSLHIASELLKYTC